MQVGPVRLIPRPFDLPATRQFRYSFVPLPPHIQTRAREAYRRFMADPGHPGVRFTAVQGVEGVWSARVGLGYRALATRDGDTVIWFWIGKHEEYDRLLRTL